MARGELEAEIDHSTNGPAAVPVTMVCVGTTTVVVTESSEVVVGVTVLTVGATGSNTVGVTVVSTPATVGSSLTTAPPFVKKT